MVMPLPLQVYQCDRCGQRVAFQSPSDVLYRLPPEQCQCGGTYVGRMPGVLDRLALRLGKIRVVCGHDPRGPLRDPRDWS